MGAADYIVWRKGLTDAAYDEWQTNFGRTLAAGAGATITAPEPTGVAMLSVTIYILRAFVPPRRADRQ